MSFVLFSIYIQDGRRPVIIEAFTEHFLSAGTCAKCSQLSHECSEIIPVCLPLRALRLRRGRVMFQDHTVGVSSRAGTLSKAVMLHSPAPGHRIGS